MTTKASNQGDRYMDTRHHFISRSCNAPRIQDSAEVERLILLAQAGDTQARDKVFNANVRLVFSIVNMLYFEKYDDYLECIQEGQLGLMRAIELFDPKKEFQLSTYATSWIKQKVYRYMETQCRTIRVPSYVQQRFRRIKRYMTNYANAHGHDPLPRVIADNTNFSEDEVINMLVIFQPTISLDEPASGTPGRIKYKSETEMASSPSDYADLSFKNLFCAEIAHMISKTLTDNEAKVIYYRFLDPNTRTLQQIGDMLHLTRERVRQLEMKALRKLRKSIDFKKASLFTNI